MKLNVGSGYPKGKYTEAGWLNIDSAPEGTIDIRGKGYECELRCVSVLEMPADWTNEFEEVHCIHMLEHLNRNFRQQVVNELARVTKPGGKCYIEVPDLRMVIGFLNAAMMNGDTKMEHNLTTSLFGKQRYEGDAHHWGFTKRTLQELCENAKFSKVSVDSSMYMNPMPMVKASFVPISRHHMQEPVLLATCIK